MPHHLSICTNGVWTRLKYSYPTYREAVLEGQKLSGYGQFTIDSPYIPTSDEQLLRKGKSAKDVFLSTL